MARQLSDTTLGQMGLRFEVFGQQLWFLESDLGPNALRQDPATWLLPAKERAVREGAAVFLVFRGWVAGRGPYTYKQVTAEVYAWELALESEAMWREEIRARCSRLGALARQARELGA